MDPTQKTTTKAGLFLCTLCALIFTFSANAEVFMGSPLAINSLVIASNEAVIISAARREYNGLNSFPAIITVNGVTNSLFFDSSAASPSVAIAGPATLSFPAETPVPTNSLPVVICYQRMVGSAIRSAVTPYGAPVNQFPAIDIPEGKTCRFFKPVAASASISRCQVNIVRGAESVNNVPIRGNEEFTGPMVLKLHYDGGTAPDNAAVFSYYITENFLVMPETGLLQGPTGSFEVSVEKSADLINWVPVVVHQTSSDQKAFYRLKLTKW